MYIAIVDYNQYNRVTKYQDYETQADADAHVARMLSDFPKAFTTLDPGGGFASWLVDPDTKTISNSPHVETQAEKDNIIKLGKDHQKIKDNILAVTLNWSNLENAMAILLESIIGISNYQFGFAIYFAAASADTRFNIVDNAIVAFFENNSHSEELLNIWGKLYKFLKKAKEKRNIIIHGNVITYGRGNPAKNYARLTAPMLSRKMTKQFQSRQIPGMSANDVEHIAENINKLCTHLTLINQAIFFINTKNDESLLKTIHELEDRLQMTTDAPTDSQTPQVP